MTLREIDKITRISNSFDGIQIVDLMNYIYDYASINQSDIVVSSYITQKEDEMRIDLISQKLLGSTDYVDFLLGFNYIINPLNITQGTLMRYLTVDEILRFLKSVENEEEIRERFINVAKRKTPDPKRKQFLEEQKAKAPLPPTVTQREFEGVRYENGQIIIGDGIFKV